MARRNRRVRRPKIGAVPGTVVASTSATSLPVRVIRYTDSEIEDVQVDSPAACRRLLDKPGVCWIDLDTAPDAATLEGLRKLLDLHPLAVADAANVPQRPKHDSYPNFDFIVLRMPMPTGRTEQLSLFLGDRWVLTVQEEKGDCLEPVRQQLAQKLGQVRSSGADYLAYALIDAVVDAYFPLVEGQFERLEQVETDMTALADRGTLRQLHRTRGELLQLRRAVWPMRETLFQLTREEVGRFTSQTRVYLRDCYDHAVQVLDLVETSREVATGLVDLHLSLVGFRTNEVMKVLTIISTIFLPLSFIAGVYGMNFDTSSPANMPELTWRFGYPIVMVLMGLVALGMLVFFRRKGWLGKSDELDELSEKTPR